MQENYRNHLSLLENAAVAGSRLTCAGIGAGVSRHEGLQQLQLHLAAAVQPAHTRTTSAWPACQIDSHDKPGCLHPALPEKH